MPYNETPMQLGDPRYQKALDLINEYSANEFDSVGVSTSDDLSDIGLMFSTWEDEDNNYEEYNLQVSVDLIDLNMNYYIFDELAHQDHYSSIEDLIESELEYLDFDALYSACIDYGKESGLIASPGDDE